MLRIEIKRCIFAQVLSYIISFSIILSSTLQEKMDLDQVPSLWRNKAVEMNIVNQGVGDIEDLSYCVCTARLHYFIEQDALCTSSSLGTITYLPLVTVKMATIAIALHGGQKETQFPPPNFLGYIKVNNVSHLSLQRMSMIWYIPCTSTSKTQLMMDQQKLTPWLKSICCKQYQICF